MIDLRALQENGRPPRVHGNGFIQLDVVPGQRLHFWGDRRIPRQRIPTPIHDHAFTFTSTCLVGRLFNIVWARDSMTDAKPTHSVWEVRAGGRREGTEDTKLAPVPPKVRRDGRVALSQVVDCTSSALDGKTVAAEMPMRVARCDVIHEGEKYRFGGPRSYHESTTDQPSASLMVKQAFVNDWKPRVLVPLGHEPDNEFNRDDYPPPLLWEIIYDICRLRPAEFGL